METFSFNKLRFAASPGANDTSLASFRCVGHSGFEVVDRKGNRLVFGNRLQGIPEVAERIGQLAAEQLTPLLLADFNGRSVDFGVLTVSQKAGVQVGGEPAIKWSDLDSVEVTDSEFGMARRLGSPVVLPLRHVSMPQVCEAILRQGLRAASAVE